jgi:hypothetical protein
MPCVTIDLNILALPLVDCSSDEVFHYLETIDVWKQLLEESWVDINMSENSFVVLDDDGVYPYREKLKELFSRTDNIDYDANTVAIVIDRIIKLTPTFLLCFPCLHINFSRTKIIKYPLGT